MRRIGLALAFLLAASGGAAAHPHVWLDNVTTFVFAGERLAALRLTWVFDEFFGTAIIRRFDANRNSRFEPEENAELEKGAFANLKDYGYFAHLTVGGKPAGFGAVTGFQGSVRNGQLVYDFTLPLAEPVDPAAAEVVVSIYDESYFVEVALDSADPVRFDRMAPGRCSFTVRDASGALSSFGVKHGRVTAASRSGEPIPLRAAVRQRHTRGFLRLAGAGGEHVQRAG